MRRSNLGGWILMGVLFVAAMAFIFYILLMRAQHFARMEENRTQGPTGSIERVIAAHEPMVVLQSSNLETGSTLAYLVYSDAV